MGTCNFSETVFTFQEYIT